MHAVVIRRDIYRTHAWVARSLYKALVESQRHVYDDFQETAALKTILAWLSAHGEELGKTMGRDWWPYGFEPNRQVIETFLRYHHEQGPSKRRLQPEELFASETLAACKI